jgi:nucleotidyltransferase substrate binding protein (TIGR01987 family)
MPTHKPLDLSALVNALSSLNEAIQRYQADPADTMVRDASIQRFEYSYELSHKMLKRFLENTESSAGEIDQMSFSSLIRTGAEKGLLKNSWDVWSVYREARNATSHTYNEKKAIEVCKILPVFLEDAEYLLLQLQSRDSTL